MTQNRAAAGGEIGINGEKYDGGQFLPSSENTIKGMIKVAPRGKKQQIAPYQWAATPADDMLSIYDRVEHFSTDNRRECQFVKGDGFIGLRVEPCAGLIKDEKFFAFIADLCEKFNAGERFYPLAADPFHHKNQ